MVLSSDNSSGSNVRSNQSKQIYANKKRELIGKSFMGRGGTRKRRANTTLL
jgi:hypothetical protein